MAQRGRTLSPGQVGCLIACSAMDYALPRAVPSGARADWRLPAELANHECDGAQDESADDSQDGIQKRARVPLLGDRADRDLLTGLGRPGGGGGARRGRGGGCWRRAWGLVSRRCRRSVGVLRHLLCPLRLLRHVRLRVAPRVGRHRGLCGLAGLNARRRLSGRRLSGSRRACRARRSLSGRRGRGRRRARGAHRGSRGFRRRGRRARRLSHGRRSWRRGGVARCGMDSRSGNHGGNSSCATE